MAKLVFRLGETETVDFDLSAESVTLGRAPENDIVINNSWISSRHARFDRNPATGVVKVTDVGSANGIAVNGEKVETTDLRHGDLLRFGQLEAQFVATEPLRRQLPRPPASVPGAPRPTVPVAPLVAPPPLVPSPPDRQKAGNGTTDLSKTQMIPVAREPAGAGVFDESIAAARAAMARKEAEAAAQRKVDAEGELTRLRAEIATATTENDALRAETSTLTARRDELASEVATLEAQRSQAIAAAATAEGERAAAVESAAQARAAAREEEARAEAARVAAEEAAATVAARSAELETLRGEAAAGEERLAECRKLSLEYESLYQRVVRLRMDDSALAGASAALAGLVAKQNATQMGIEQRDRRIAEQERTLADLEAKISASTTALAEGDDAKTKLATELAAATARRDRISAELADAEAALARAAEGAAEGEATMARLDQVRSAVAALEQQKSELEATLVELTENARLAREAVTPEWGTVHVFARGVIKRLGLIEDFLEARHTQEAAAVQIAESVREMMLEVLAEHDVRPFTVEPGQVLDIATRKRITIVEPSREPGEVTEVAEVYRCGFACDNGGEGPPTLLRKVEVATRRR